MYIYYKQKDRCFIVASKDFCLEVNDETTKYMFMSLEINTGKYPNLKIGNKSIESVGQFKCLGTTIKNQNCFNE
jgi:hypothetical protein